MARPGPSESRASLLHLIQDCPELRQASRIVAGFSGGVDSTVLLYLLHEARQQGMLTASVEALHVNHAMQADADRWQQHCRQFCETLDIPFLYVRSPVLPVAGESLEETARDARHTVFASVLQTGDVLVLAQHADDQVETVLFRLLRGGGAAGLSGMPHSRACGKGLLVRPLLNARRAQVLDYAEARELTWIEDGSNTDQRFDRNFLRGAVLPLLRERWPGLGAAVQRSARLSAEAALLLDELAELDLAEAIGPKPGQLCIDALLPLGETRQRNLLRYWLQGLCREKSWAAPTHQVLERIVSEVLTAAPDREPLLTWGSAHEAVELRRHRDLLHVFAPLPPLMQSATWHTGTSLTLPQPFGTIELQPCNGRGLPRTLLAHIDVRFRSGGELVKAAGRPTRPLKKILQDAGVPPWLREHVPLLYVRNELIAVADLLICEGWMSDDRENTCRVVWLHPDLDCGYHPHLLI
jgi:tRNA(Ile)-lysidine synthase